jgi:hypothetical protein
MLTGLVHCTHFCPLRRQKDGSSVPASHDEHGAELRPFSLLSCSTLFT